MDNVSSGLATAGADIAGAGSAVTAIGQRTPVAADRWNDRIDRVQNLSERELDVFLMLGAGNSNRTMAKQLDIAERTVKAHITHILAKLGVESRLQAGLVSYAFQLTSDVRGSRDQSSPLLHTKSA